LSQKQEIKSAGHLKLFIRAIHKINLALLTETLFISKYNPLRFIRTHWSSRILSESSGEMGLTKNYQESGYILLVIFVLFLVLFPNKATFIDL